MVSNCAKHYNDDSVHDTSQFIMKWLQETLLDDWNKLTKTPKMAVYISLTLKWKTIQMYGHCPNLNTFRLGAATSTSKFNIGFNQFNDHEENSTLNNIL